MADNRKVNERIHLFAADPFNKYVRSTYSMTGNNDERPSHMEVTDPYPSSLTDISERI